MLENTLCQHWYYKIMVFLKVLSSGPYFLYYIQQQSNLI